MTEERNLDALVGEKEILLLIASRSGLGRVLESVGIKTVSKKENGEPYLEGSPYRISLTHKGDVAIAALSRSSVGVDVEDVTVPRNVERLSRLFDQGERPTTLYDFYKVWTAKEAIGKRLGTGISSDLLKQKAEGIRHIDYGDYLIAVAGDGEIKTIEYNK